LPRGGFITIEGGEGAGKSTHSRRLAETLRARGLDVVQTREPGGASGAEGIRDLLLGHHGYDWEPVTEALLHFAARREHLSKTVLPALERGDWVVSDRFADSTMAYQGYGLGLGREVIERLYALSIGDFRPDVTIILDLAAEDGMARARARGDDLDRYEVMDLEFHRRLRQGFLDIAERDRGRCVVVDATAAVEDVGAEILAAVQSRLAVPSP
jgi:dTMP kinase